jgi:hypothetical protein
MSEAVKHYYDHYAEMALAACPPPAFAIDLGALHGGAAACLQSAGYEVLAIEGRPENINIGRMVHPDIPFLEADVRDPANIPFCDLAVVSGILYHLEKPWLLLETLGQRVSKTLILSTHISFQPTETVNGFRGHYYAEPLGHPWAALSNSRSFWPTLNHLYIMLGDAGFPHITPYLEPMGMPPDRFVCTASKIRP